MLTRTCLFPTLLAAFALAIGCGDDGSGTTSETQGTTTTVGDADGTMTTSNGTSDTGTTAAETTGGANGGFCGQSCSEPVDCCPADDKECQADPSAYNCDTGVCKQPACEVDDDCPLDLECHEVGGEPTCFGPCDPADDQCAVALPNAMCIGRADDGAMFCKLEDTPCMSDKECGGLVCVEGDCVCVTDDECGDLLCIDGTCLCTEDGQCEAPDDTCVLP